MRDLHFHFSRSSSDLHFVDVSYAITLMLIRVLRTEYCNNNLHLKWTIAVASLHQLDSPLRCIENILPCVTLGQSNTPTLGTYLRS
jgi:hypothetical protein